MNEEIEKRMVGESAVMKQARVMDSIPLSNVIEGMRTAKELDDKVRRSEKEKRDREANPEPEVEAPVPTKADIEEDRYR